ncbi:MAG: GNAT family N-acetyltransferase [Rhodanobacteraceae bacterium]
MAIPAGFHVEVCDWANAAEREALLAVRDEVFVLEQQVPLELDRDDDDPRSIHVLARAEDGTPIGTGRLTVGDADPGWLVREPDGVLSGWAEVGPDMRRPRAVEAGQDGRSSVTGRIARMAVLHDWRGRGVGTMLLHTLVDLAGARNLETADAHAQRDAVHFYQRHGFEEQGEEFEEAGIAHVRMRRKLAPRAQPERPLPPAAPEPVLLQATTREELIAVTKTLLSRARHSMCVLVRELHPILLNDTACLVELRRLAISGRGASLRMIAQDLTRALNEGTRLLQLAQRMSSVIEIRRPVDPADLNFPSAFMCVDTEGYLFRPIEHQMVARGSTWAPGRHAELMRLFESVWNRSEPWPELRALGI